MRELHSAAAEGFQSGATTYANGRPGYADDAVDWLKTDLELTSGSVALELGAGTGKFTRRLLATGADIIAVEPVAAMRAELAAACPTVRVVEAGAETLPFEPAAVDVVVCAQSFHWFANKTALAEIRRVLKPGGRLGLIWNVRDERVPWVEALTEIMRPYEGDAPRYHDAHWKPLFPADGFSALEARHFAYQHTGTPDQVIVNRVLSTSFIAALPADEQARVVARVRDVIAASPDLAGRDEVSYPYETVAYSCTRLS